MIFAHADLVGLLICAGAFVGGCFVGWHFPQPKWLGGKK